MELELNWLAWYMIYTILFLILIAFGLSSQTTPQGFPHSMNMLVLAVGVSGYYPNPWMLRLRTRNPSHRACQNVMRWFCMRRDWFRLTWAGWSAGLEDTALETFVPVMQAVWLAMRLCSRTFLSVRTGSMLWRTESTLPPKFIHQKPKFVKSKNQHF